MQMLGYVRPAFVANIFICLDYFESVLKSAMATSWFWIENC